MIQRIQSILLLLTSGAFFSEFIFPFAYSDVEGSGFLSDKEFTVQDHPVLLILAILGGLVALAAIFQFSNRSRQMVMSRVSIVLGILLPLVAFLLVYMEPDKQGDLAVYNDGIGLYLPFIAILCSILAIRFIKKDDKLVKSMDRLR
jgi:Mn2+/Fe2+ NRAMP family transporter